MEGYKKTIDIPLILLLLVLCSIGCSGIPFQKASFVSVASVQPEVVREQFSQCLPIKFRLTNSTVFRYKRQNIATLGYIIVDTAQKNFTVLGLNPIGVKLFEIYGDSQTFECRFLLEEFTRMGDFAQAVADDIRRIYFDRIPPPEAEVSKDKYKIIFKQPTGDGTIEYVFAGDEYLLIEKRYLQKNRPLWTVFYYEYLQKNGKKYPTGIILKHYNYQYELIIRLKEIHS